MADTMINPNVETFRSTGVSGISNLIFSFGKTVAVLFFICFFFVHSLSLELFEPRRWRLKRKRSKLLCAYSKLALQILGVKTRQIGERRDGERAYLMVGNHLSYLDILILAATRPMLFVTSQEVREMPFLGALTVLGGCLFVDRRTRQNLQFEISEIEEALKRGIHVTIFPEATSTNGAEVLRFRRPLFRAAISAQVEVKPFCLNYSAIDKEKIDQTNRDRICWYGDMQFLPHLWQLSRASRIDVDLLWLEKMSTDVYRNEHDLSLVSHERVSNAFKPF